MRRCVSMVLLVIGLLAGTPITTAAQPTPTTPDDVPTFLLRPESSAFSWFDLKIEPGASVTETLVFGMSGPEPLGMSLYLADAYSAVNGGFGVREKGTERTGPTTWVTFPDEDVTLIPEDVHEREIEISVPAGTAPGQYITSIAMETTEALEVAGGAGFTQILRTAVAILITVPGPVEPSFTAAAPVLTLDVESATLQVEIANTGNILVKPMGSARLYDAAGTEVAAAPVGMDSVYAGMITTFQIVFPSALAHGAYTLTIELEDAETGATVRLDREPVTETAVEEEVQPQLTLDAFTVEPVTNDAGDVQLATMVVQFSNTGSPVPSVKVTVHVTRDGEAVEDYVLSPGAAVASGMSELQQRYVPITGWESGEWSFTVTVESVDPTSGQSALVGTIEAPVTISVP